MPPPLSDYDSDGEIDIIGTIEPEAHKGNSNPMALSPRSPTKKIRGQTKLRVKITSKCNSVTSTYSRGKKQPALLAGLDSENIIKSGDEESPLDKDIPPPSSIPTSLHRTRAQVHGLQGSELCYDQRYHPMDDYTNPKRAAKIRVMYGEKSPTSDSDISSFDEGNNTECDTDVEDNSRKSRKGQIFPIPPTMQPARRTSRRVNRNVMYNTNVHPQDAFIEAADKVFRAADAPHKRIKIVAGESETSNEETDEEEDAHAKEIEDVGREVEEEVEKGEDAMENASVCGADPADATNLTEPEEIEDGVSNSSTGKPPPTFVAERDNIPSTIAEHEKRLDKQQSAIHETSRPVVVGKSFTIYEESHQMQLAVETAVLSPLRYDHDDKENDVVNNDLGEPQHPYQGITVHPVSVSQMHAQVYGPDSIFDFGPYVHIDDPNAIDSVLGRPSSSGTGLGLDGARLPDTDEVQWGSSDGSGFEAKYHAAGQSDAV